MSIMRDLKFFLWLQIKHSREGIFVCQSKYAIELVDKIGLLGFTDAKVSMSPSCKLVRDKDGKPVDRRLHQSMIWSLLYLTSSRLDIMLSMCLCARYQSNPIKFHMVAIEKIIKYIKHTRDFV